MIEFAVAQQIKVQDMLARLMNQFEREEGQDLIEYAVLVVFIAIVCIAAVTLLGPKIATVFNTITSDL